MAISLKYESLKLLLRYPHKKKQASTVPSAFIFRRRQLACFQGVFLPGNLLRRIVRNWRCTSVGQVRRVTHRSGAHGVA
ncbi:MAG TPA: hypothetical protein VN325_23610 [Steroidobacteraceae bacterium]|nr:hypothetical protein [Steroidobacteraceae bacterium]